MIAPGPHHIEKVDRDRHGQHLHHRCEPGCSPNNGGKQQRYRDERDDGHGRQGVARTEVEAACQRHANLGTEGIGHEAAVVAVAPEHVCADNDAHRHADRQQASNAAVELCWGEAHPREQNRSGDDSGVRPGQRRQREHHPATDETSGGCVLAGEERKEQRNGGDLECRHQDDLEATENPNWQAGRADEEQATDCPCHGVR